MQPIVIHTLLIGQPQTHADARGTWRSAIYRTPLEGPVELTERGLAGDRVADKKHHGRPDQAVCAHPLAHYSAWNAEYGLARPDEMLGPGSVGENWTLSGVTEADVCIGDIYRVGTARVQVSAPRFPCSKQERKLGLDGYLKRTVATRRTGFYLRVLTPGTVQAGDALVLEARPHPDVTVERVNRQALSTRDPDEGRALLEVAALSDAWKAIIRDRLPEGA